MLYLTSEMAQKVGRGWLLAALSVWPATAAAQPGNPVEPTASPRIGKPIPDVSFSTLDGDTLRPADRMGRLMVLAYVRQRQMLSQRLLCDLQAEYDRFRKNSIDVIAVASGDSSREYWRDLVSKHGIQFPLAFDVGGQLPKSMGWKALPVTAVVDGKGRVASTIFLHRASFARILWREMRRAKSPGGDELGQQTAVAEARQAATRRVQELVLAGHTKEALSAIAQVRSRYPDRFAVRMLLGKALIELGYPTEAIEDFVAARKLGAASLRARFWLGVAHARSGNDHRAEILLNETVESMPDAWRGYGELGMIQHRRKNLKEAARLLQRSVNGEIHSIWSTGSAWVGSQAPSLEVVDVKANPRQPTVLLSVDARPRPTVVLFWRTGDEASLECLRQLQNLYAGLGGEKLGGEKLGGKKLVIAAVNVDKRRFSDADQARVREAAEAAGACFSVWLDPGLEAFLRYDIPAIPTTLLIDHRGVVQNRILGADSSAIEGSVAALVASAAAASTQPITSTQPTISTQPTGNSVPPRRASPDRFLALARRLARQGDLAAAIDSARRSLAEPPAPAGAAALLGRLLSASDRLDQAAEVLAEATRNPSIDPGLSTAYGDCLSGLGLTGQAERWYRRALDVCAAYAPAHVGLGRALAAAGANEQALEEARLAAKLNPHDERAFVLAAEILKSINRLPEAVEAYQAAYRLRWERNDSLARHW